MSHFAKVNPQGIVTNVIVAEQDFIDSYFDTEPGKWIQTSYNTYGGVHYDPVTRQPSADQSKALRKNYAGIGSKYDEQRDAFIPPQPFPSWTLDEVTCLWIPPTEIPHDNNAYVWNESELQWDMVTNAQRTID